MTTTAVNEPPTDLADLRAKVQSEIERIDTQGQTPESSVVEAAASVLSMRWVLEQLDALLERQIVSVDLPVSISNVDIRFEGNSMTGILVGSWRNFSGHQIIEEEVRFPMTMEQLSALMVAAGHYEMTEKGFKTTPPGTKHHRMVARISFELEQR